MSANGINGTVPKGSTSAPTSATIAGIGNGKTRKYEDDAANAMDSFRTIKARFHQSQKQPVRFPYEVLESRRAAILKEKQAVLKHTIDRHDNLVRSI